MSASNASATVASTSTFITSLVLNLIIAGVEIAAFTLIRRQFKTIYEPRTFIPEERNRESPLSPSLLGWPWALIKSDPKLILAKNGVDAYVFVRFLRMIVKILFPIWIISWIVLMPIDAANTGSSSSASGLDKFTFGNVGTSSQKRYAAHLILAWLFTGYILYVLKDEMREWITVRQRYLVSEEHSSLPQANTILVTGVPTSYLHEEKLKQLYSHLPGGVKKIWLNRDLKEMPDVYEERLKACAKLESAETKLAKTAAKLRLKAEKASHKKNGAPLDEKWNTTGNLENDQTLAEKLVPAKERPSHRLPPFKWLPFALPFMGEKVDTIDWCRDKIVQCSEVLHSSRAQLDKDRAATSSEDLAYPPLSSAFILFNQQIAAHMAAATLNHHQPYTMHKRYLELAPDDVIWSNLGMNSYEQQIRTAISWGITIALIVLWAFPVAFVGVVSNVSGLCVKYSWMAWLCKLPSVVVGIISGVLPPVLLAVLFMLLPIVLRLLAKFEGIPRRTGLELSLMTRYFIFLFIHGFIITTLASGLIAALPQIAANPSSIATILANNLPKASNFFLTYVALQGIAGAAGNFIQYVPLAIYYVKLFLLGSTPRSVYNIKYTMRSTSWGTTFPNITLLVVITFGYSLISPIINGLACFSFVLLYLAWKYLFTWVYDNPTATETGGLFFPKAITHCFVGLYVQQVCLCALFFLARDSDGKASSIPQGALMVVLIVFTVGYQYTLNDSYNPLEMSLPLSLAHKSAGMPVEDGHEGSVIGDEHDEQVTHDKAPLNPSQSNAKALNGNEEKPEQFELQQTGTRSPGGGSGLKKGQSAIDDAFAHPASWEDQRPIWLAKDDLGVSEEAVRLLTAAQIHATLKDAEMSPKGKVDVAGAPPETTHHQD